MAENFSKYKFELMTNINCNFVTTDKIDFSVKTNIDKSLYINSKFIQSNSISSQENSLSQRNYIAKKTNRGRKEKNKLDNDQLKCQVCFAFEEISTEDLISCSICKCLFHKSCFSQYEEVTSSPDLIQEYRCIRCSHAIKLNKDPHEFKCFICNHSNGVLKFNRVQGIYYHQICHDNLPEFNEIKEEQMSKDLIKKWRYKNSCKYCGQKLSKNVAVTKCKNPKCKEHYHIPCAVAKGNIFDLKFMKEFYHVDKNNQIPFYCSNHNKKIYNQYKNYIINFKNLDNKLEKNEEKKEMLCNEETMSEEELNEEKKDENDNNKEIFDDWRSCSSKKIDEGKDEFCDKNDEECKEEEGELEEEEFKEEYEEEDEDYEDINENKEIIDLNESFEYSKDYFSNSMKKIFLGIDYNNIPLNKEFNSKKRSNYISFSTIFDCFNCKKSSEL